MSRARSLGSLVLLVFAVFVLSTPMGLGTNRLTTRPTAAPLVTSGSTGALGTSSPSLSHAERALALGQGPAGRWQLDLPVLWHGFSLVRNGRRGLPGFLRTSASYAHRHLGESEREPAFRLRRLDGLRPDRSRDCSRGRRMLSIVSSRSLRDRYDVALRQQQLDSEGILPKPGVTLWLGSRLGCPR